MAPDATAPQVFVLVHGGFHGGWCWREVADTLRARGHRVFAPTLTGLGERHHQMRPGIGWDTFITDIAQLLQFEEIENAVLVGHSFSGGTITGVADRCSGQLRHLIYLDAMILQSGQSALDTAPAELIDSYRAKAMAFSGGISVPPNPPSYYGITDPEQSARLNRLMTPHPLDSFFDPLVLAHPVGNGLPVTYIACMDPPLASTASSRSYAKTRRDWTYVEITAPHNVMMTAPQALADLLEQSVTG